MPQGFVGLTLIFKDFQGFSWIFMDFQGMKEISLHDLPKKNCKLFQKKFAKISGKKIVAKNIRKISLHDLPKK